MNTIERKSKHDLPFVSSKMSSLLPLGTSRSGRLHVHTLAVLNIASLHLKPLYEYVVEKSSTTAQQFVN